jgi:hypothetical protein
MRLIAHRGNLTGPNPIKENSIEYIEEAIAEGFDVEVDIRHEDHNFYLGHDEPQYYVPMSWLVKYKDVLWIHCKNLEALEKMSNSVVEFNYFWHETDSYTITSKGIGWVYPGKKPYSNSVLVMPENAYCSDEYINQVYGICTDKVIYYKDFLWKKH